MASRTFAPAIKGILATSLLLASTGATLLAQPGKLAPDLANLDPNESVDVIIQLEDTPAPRPGAPRPARPLALGGVNLAAQRPVRELGLINGLAARVSGAALASLATDPRVKYVSPDREVLSTLQNAIPAVNANAAQAAGFDGRGIGIAVIDSGINRHVDFLDESCGSNTSRIVYRQNFAPADPPYSSQAPAFAIGSLVFGGEIPVGPGTEQPDLYGHGTHVAAPLLPGRSESVVRVPQ